MMLSREKKIGVLLRFIKYFSITDPISFEEITSMSVPEQNRTLRKYVDELSNNFVGIETLRYRWAKMIFLNISVDPAKQKALMVELDDKFHGSPWDTCERWINEKLNIQDQDDPISLSNYQFGGREVNTFSDNQPGDDCPFRSFELETLPVDEHLASGQRLCYNTDSISMIDGVKTATA